jgi:hypothetical protein
MSLFTLKVNIIACPIVKKTKKKLMNLKKKKLQEGPAATPAPPGNNELCITELNLRVLQ